MSAPTNRLLDQACSPDRIVGPACHQKASDGACLDKKGRLWFWPIFLKLVESASPKCSYRDRLFFRNPCTILRSELAALASELSCESMMVYLQISTQALEKPPHPRSQPFWSQFE